MLYREGNTETGAEAKLERRGDGPDGAPARAVDSSEVGFIDSESVRAIKADERSESLDSFL